ncbi:DivIVA domain-containing protein [Actinomadura sp. HBU206391]|uniref:DivIVA domain-containing protein n=1 Tax=Actinomadura sp. HBU206391 TaxID=2731692 RepID=UPI00164F0F29|nr:DivIVA domain-containing protein [Actinomadura sp. HBU206391]MBC6459576.1 DivIVA domain-containing protein [Actinomadura sp. HBU206391]
MTQLDDVVTHADTPAGNPGAADGPPAAEPGGPAVGAEAGWLTPADVHNKVFATVRFREGYDLGQVDTFLYEVETTLSGILRENAALRARLDSSRHGPGSAADSASRIVALAQQTADRAIVEAQGEAREIIAAARVRAEAVKREALAYGSRLRESLESQIGQLRGLLVEIDERDETY